MDSPLLSHPTGYRDMWAADPDLSTYECQGRSISPELGHALDEECPFLLRWPDRVHKSVEVSARSPSRSPTVLEDRRPGLIRHASSPAPRVEDELYDTEPPPGFKMLKRKRDTRPTRHVTTSTNSSRTSARQQSLGDGFSAEEAKPLKEKTESHGKKRKRCDPSPILGTLQVVLLTQTGENTRSKDGESGPGSVSRSIIEPLRPRPMAKKEAMAAGDVIWVGTAEDNETDEAGGTDESGISVACDADGSVVAESETMDEATPVNSGESGQGRDRDWDGDWSWDCSTAGLPSLR